MTMTTKFNKRNLPWLAAAAIAFLLANVGAQEDCPATTDCLVCLQNPNCFFAVGTCSSECQEPENGATCYSIQNVEYTGLVSGSELCDLYESDNARCTAQRNCQDCTSTLKSDGNSCQWYAGVYENGDGACFGGGIGPYGPGALTCEDDATDPPAETDPPTETDSPTPEPVVETDAPTTPAPTLAPTDTTDDPTTAPIPIGCPGTGSDCTTCLDAGCAWFPIGLCEPVCSDVQDTVCYDGQTFPDLDVEGTCEAAVTAAADRELCFTIENCDECTSTVKSDGSNCLWYIDVATGVSWCQAGGCDENGICGNDFCEVDADPLVEDTDPPVVTMAPTDVPVMVNDTNTTDWECTDFDVYGSQGCEPCLNSPKNCAWSLNSCVTSCDVIADAPCIDSSTFRDTPIATVCAVTNVQQEDVALCGSKNYCFTCTSTTKSDGTPCSWYVDGDREWCGAGGCNSEGVCGSNDEAICQQAETPDETVTEPDIPPTAAPAVTSSANKKTTAVMSMIVALMTLARQ